MPAGQRDWNAKCPTAVAKGLSPHLPAKNLPALRQGRRREGKQPPEGNKSLPEKGKLKQKRHHSLRRWLVQDVGVGTANRLGRCEAGGVVCWGQAPEHGSCVFSLQGHRQGLKQLLNALGRREPDASSMQRPKFFPSGRSGGPHPPQQASTTRGTNWRPWPWQCCSVF